VSADIPAMQRFAGARRRRAATREGKSGADPTPSPPVLPSPTARGPIRPFFAGGWPAARYDFRTGATRLDVFPARVWERLLGAAWRDLAAGHGTATSYAEPEGDELLRRELADRLGLDVRR